MSGLEQYERAHEFVAANDNVDRETEKKEIMELFEVLGQHVDTIVHYCQQSVEHINEKFAFVSSDIDEGLAALEEGGEIMERVFRRLNTHRHSMREIYGDIVKKIPKLGIDADKFSAVVNHGEQIQHLRKKLGKDKEPADNEQSDVASLAAKRQKISDNFQLSILQFLQALDYAMVEFNYNKRVLESLSQDDKLQLLRDKIKYAQHYVHQIGEQFDQQKQLLSSVISICFNSNN